MVALETRAKWFRAQREVEFDHRSQLGFDAVHANSVFCATAATTAAAQVGAKPLSPDERDVRGGHAVSAFDLGLPFRY